jgi:small subunit ribosomal protein S13
MEKQIMEKQIVRFAGTDLDGRLAVVRALRKIKGISFMLASAACSAANIDPSIPIGKLDDQSLNKLEDVIKNLRIPEWMANRRKDPETGQTQHLIGTALDMKRKEDIAFLKKIRCYRGIRHELGLPVRGQRTRTSFRTKRVVGVRKKK